MQLENQNKIYKSDNHMIYSCQYHVIFCPKYRRRVLINGIDTRLKQLIIEKQIEYDYEIIGMEIMPDHVHLLISVSPKIGIFPTINKIKGYTSNTIRKE